MLHESNTVYSDWCVRGYEANEAWQPFFDTYMSAYSKCVPRMQLVAGVMLSNQTSSRSPSVCAAVDPAEHEYGDGLPNDDGYPCMVRSLQISRIMAHQFEQAGG